MLLLLIKHGTIRNTVYLEYSFKTSESWYRAWPWQPYHSRLDPRSYVLFGPILGWTQDVTSRWSIQLKHSLNVNTWWYLSYMAFHCCALKLSSIITKSCSDMKFTLLLVGYCCAWWSRQRIHNPLVNVEQTLSEAVSIHYFHLDQNCFIV